MADGVEDEKEPKKDSNNTSATSEDTVSTVSSVASSLAGMFLEKTVRDGREIEIPSLDIIIGKANLRYQNDSRSNGNDRERH